jgi:hypothetical protein
MVIGSIPKDIDLKHYASTYELSMLRKDQLESHPKAINKGWLKSVDAL